MKFKFDINAFLKEAGESTAFQLWLQQMGSLLSVKRLLNTWGILPFVVMLIMSFLPGGKPLFSEHINLDTLVIGLLFVWSLQFAVFMQEGGTYTLVDAEDAISNVEGNKNIWMFFTSAVITVIAFFIVGTATNAPAFAIAVALQVTPLFIGKNTLREQALFLGPQIVSIAWILLAIVAVGFGA